MDKARVDLGGPGARNMWARAAATPWYSASAQMVQNKEILITEPPLEKRPGLSLSGKIAAALGAGVVCGLFFGESVEWLRLPGDAYIGLLQMTVLPYIVLGLIGGIGKLRRDQISLLAGRVVLIVAGLWSLAWVAVLFVPMVLPKQTSASFFSTGVDGLPTGFDFLGLFVPANLFWSLAENKVPAVVVFCILCGVVLVNLRNKDSILRMIDSWSELISGVTRLVVELSPIGVFCIAASAAGTVGIEELGRIQGYLVVSSIISLGLALGVLPALMTVFSPFRYRDFAPVMRSALILAFATGKTLVVLPILAAGIRDMFERRGSTDDETMSTVEVLVPLGYSFPHLGRLLSTTFIPFAAWYAGTPLSPEQYPVLLGASLFVHFSTAPVSIPFLLDLMKLPADLFDLFLLTGVFVGRLGDVVAASYILTLTVLGTCAVTGLFRVRWKRLGLVAAVTVVIGLLLVAGSRRYLNVTAKHEYNRDEIVASMQALVVHAPSSIVEPGPNPVPLMQGQSHLDRSFAREIFRVGFVTNSLPFSYFNTDDELVGFDIDMVHRLARELDMALEFVPIDSRGDIGSQLEQDFYDFAVGGIADTIERSRLFRFSEPYLTVTMALVVPDYRDHEFSSIQSIKEIEGLTLGVVFDDWFQQKHRERYPNIDTVVLGSPRDFFEGTGNGAGVDALLFNAEAGSAWTLLYPQYQVVIPGDRPTRVPLIYPYAGSDDLVMDEFIDNWIMLKNNDGTIDALYDYWILGRGTEKRTRRWNILRDVLGYDVDATASSQPGKAE